MKSEIIAHDLHYRVTQANGSSHVQCVRVWDGDRFLAAQRDAGAKAEKAEDRFTVSPATRDEYRAQHARK